MHHWRDGWMFERQADGAVRIWNDNYWTDQRGPVVDLMIPADEWVSIIAAVAEPLATETELFAAASALHKKVINVSFIDWARLRPLSGTLCTCGAEEPKHMAGCPLFTCDAEQGPTEEELRDYDPERSGGDGPSST